MTRTCILHIGLAKTGSTSIQQALHGFDDGRISYARFRDSNHSSPLFVLFCQDPARLNIQSLNWRTPRQHARLVARSKAAFNHVLEGPGDVILSGEAFASKLAPDEIGHMSDLLSRHFDRVRIIAYFRPYQSLCPSAWQQNVKWGQRNFKPPVPNFRAKLQPFIDHFGRDSLETILFDRKALLDGDIVTDFASRIGIDPTSLPRFASNESISLDALSIVFAHNVFDFQARTLAERRSQQKELVVDLQGFGQGRFGFDEQIMALACRRHAEDLDWASELVGADMTGEWQAVEQPIGNLGQLLSIAAEKMPRAQLYLEQVRSGRVKATATSAVIGYPASKVGRAGSLTLEGRSRRTGPFVWLWQKTLRRLSMRQSKLHRYRKGNP